MHRAVSGKPKIHDEGNDQNRGPEDREHRDRDNRDHEFRNIVGFDFAEIRVLVDRDSMMPMQFLIQFFMELVGKRRTGRNARAG